MGFFSYMRTGDFWKQILLMLLAAVFLVALVLISLNLFTRHGQEIRVADIRGLNQSQLQSYTEEFGFKFVVRDSVYQDGIRPGTILSQSPLPGSIVKKNRTFYIVVAASRPSSVQMPELADLSLRQAEALLETYGLKVGKVTEVLSVVKGSVMRQLIQGEEIPAGSPVQRGSVIDLEIGNGKGEWVASPDSLPLPDMDMPAGESSDEVLEEGSRREDGYGEDVYGEETYGGEEAYGGEERYVGEESHVGEEAYGGAAGGTTDGTTGGAALPF